MAKFADRDVNQLAARIVASSTGDDEADEKDPEAVEAGREGGRRRAAKLTPEQRSEIARKAARARWSK